MKRTVEQEKIWLDEKTNFHYIRRGVERTPPGTKVKIVECNSGLCTSEGTLKGTVALGLLNVDGHFAGQMIAWSYDADDLVLFAIEHHWDMDDDTFRILTENLYGETASEPSTKREDEGS